ncbi:hypothetical protein ABC345_09715 [Shouchella sp. 1P09AA]|uniref:hypothetical protein n=1 Tax=unclassified Shouchella TaxID=2893065 RepID=UPI0039A1013E
MKIKLTFENGIKEMASPKGKSTHVIGFLYNMIHKIEDNESIEVTNSEDAFSKTTWQNLKTIEIEIEENDKMEP